MLKDEIKKDFCLSKKKRIEYAQRRDQPTMTNLLGSCTNSSPRHISICITHSTILARYHRIQRIASKVIQNTSEERTPEIYHINESNYLNF